ncbi:MAG: type I DNA topoisomerase [Patescibacteria group bacterium]|nr:type I DNA topoisomerase [Patescibacteria group bacterium]
MKLVIVESPSKAKTIEKYLGSDYKVLPSVGHVRDLPKSNKDAIDIAGGFIPHYVVSPGKEKVISEIKSAAKKASEVLLATDPDREGEAIAWHIKEAANLAKPKRVRFYEITKDAVKDAINHPTDIDENLRRAQEARRVLDRLVGYDLSGLIWKKVRYGLSAGRVQSPALRIIMEREREIRAFQPEGYWVIEADLKTASGATLTFSCDEEPHEAKIAENILAVAKKNPWAVKDISETEAKRAARAPFTTSTLQQAASTRLGFSPSRTMGVAQKLYEAGFITYMRTDSTNLAASALDQMAAVVSKKYGAAYAKRSVYATKSKNAQEAHEAIRPTDAAREIAGANDEQKKLYRLIWQRTLASQMADAKILRTKITAEVKSKDAIPTFSVNGSRTLFDGWLAADPEARGEDVELPKVAAGETLKLLDIRSAEKFTEPPARYSEAGLIKELEKRGIGRPSTYASIMKTLEDREYVTKTNRTLVPTDTGEVVSDFLEKYFPSYISDTFTAEMEDELDDIADGKRSYEKTLKDFYGPFAKDVKSKEKVEKVTNLGEAGSEFKCPVCGSSMIVKLGKNGKFLSCSRFPDCNGALMIDGTELPKDRVIGTDPATGLAITSRSGKYGPYVQLGEDSGKGKTKVKARKASIPKSVNPADVTLEQALVYLSLPRDLGVHPVTSKKISANIGRFGPYIVHDGDFRSLKKDDVYTIELPRALEILAEEKKTRRGRFSKKAK